MFEVNGVKIGKGYKPFIIAELSANHGGDLQRAKNSICAAMQSGVDAVKIQTYTPDTMTIDSNREDFVINKGLWKGYNLYDLYKEAFTPFEWHKELFEFASKIGITIFSTPFDETAVDLLDDLNTPAFKIASFELIDLPLIKYVAQKSKPIFISTGMSNCDEIANAIETCFQAGNKELLLFHCISNYPTELVDSNLGDIKYLAKHFNVEVGLSDHTKSNMASILSVALGASAIEKHFKLDDDKTSIDAFFSLNISKLNDFKKELTQISDTLGHPNLKIIKGSLKNINGRRSLYVVKNILKGETFNNHNIKSIRPANGMHPKFLKRVIGKKSKINIRFGTPLNKKFIKNF